MHWSESMEFAEKGIHPIYAKITGIHQTLETTYRYSSISTLLDVIKVAFRGLDDRELVRHHLNINIEIERELTLAEILPILSKYRHEELKFRNEHHSIDVKHQIGVGIALVEVSEEISRGISRSGPVSTMQIEDVLARLVLAEKTVSIKRLRRIEVLNDHYPDCVEEFLEIESKLKDLEQMDVPDERNQLSRRLKNLPDLIDKQQLRLILPTNVLKRLLFGEGLEK